MIEASRRDDTPKDRRLILYVEDNLDIRSAYATILRRAGFRVAEAGDGAEGFQRALELAPDLVLMDLALPGVDGYEASARLKQHPETRHIPIIALSAHAFDEARAHHCDGYIAKPLEGTEVVRHVMRFFVVRRRPPPPPTRRDSSSMRRAAQAHFGADAPSAQPHDSTSSSQSQE